MTKRLCRAAIERIWEEHHERPEKHDERSRMREAQYFLVEIPLGPFGMV